jgi:hypothetical protein
MALAITFSSKQEVLDHLRLELEHWPGASFKDEQVRFEPIGDDVRIDWKNVHAILIDGYGVMGYCEGLPED